MFDSNTPSRLLLYEYSSTQVVGKSEQHLSFPCKNPKCLPRYPVPAPRTGGPPSLAPRYDPPMAGGLS
uniref:Uncharacterized protein n=1 Tax=Panagrellus redivivus TaxID=6233 RepID=A0A7E4VY76_PANRE